MGAWRRMRVAYADPPYPGMAHYYRHHPDYAGEINHRDLIDDLVRDFDSWVLHTASTTLHEVLALCPREVRVGAWVKPFASFKPGVNHGYCWEPVIFHGGRNDSSKTRLTVRDFVSYPITLKRGLTGAKPEAVCRWAFEMLGMERDDDLVDLFPGSGAVTRSWDAWRSQLVLDGAA